MKQRLRSHSADSAASPEESNPGLFHGISGACYALKERGKAPKYSNCHYVDSWLPCLAHKQRD